MNAARPASVAALAAVAVWAGWSSSALAQGGAMPARYVIDPRSPSAIPPDFPPATLRTPPGTTPAPPPIPIGPRPAAPRQPAATPPPRQVAPATPVCTEAPYCTGVRPGGPRRPLSVQALSLTHLVLPEPRAIAVHDIITVLVDEKSEVAVQSRFDRRRSASLDASIDEFVRLDPTGRLILSATGDPAMDVSSGVRIQSDGRSLDTEAVRYRIAAEVVDVLPNGNVVLEARKEIRSNGDVWEYRLTGTIAAEKVRRDMTALSEDIANMQVDKQSAGKVFSSAARAWGVRMLDVMWPF